MKKAKIILAGIAALAIVGGVYAFKAHRISDVIYVRTISGGTLCTKTLRGYTTRPNGQPPVFITFVSTIPGACPILVPVYTGL